MYLHPASLGILLTVGGLWLVERSRLADPWKAALCILLAWGFPLSLWYLP
jgi:hypothetical protein